MTFYKYQLYPICYQMLKIQVFLLPEKIYTDTKKHTSLLNHYIPCFTLESKTIYSNKIFFCLYVCYNGDWYRKHIRKFENVQDFNHDQFFFNKIKVIIIYTMISFYSFYLRRNFKKSSWIGNLFKTFFLLTYYYQLLAFFFGGLTSLYINVFIW